MDLNSRFSRRRCRTRRIRLRLIAALLCVTLPALSGPPENIAGLTFYQTAYRGSPFSYKADYLLLTATGGYVGLISMVYRQGTATGASTTMIGVLAEVSIPPDGTWRYRVIDGATAELVLDGKALVLHFDAGRPTGYVGFVPSRPADFFSSTRFSFDSYETSARIVNCSSRSYLAPGRSVSLGFVIADGVKRVLIRAIGPGLRTFGVTQPLENLRLHVREAGFVTFTVDSAWPAVSSATLEIAAQHAGAFPSPTANDLAKFLTLRPGAYIVEVTATDNQSSGEVLIEVYQLP